MLPLLAGHRFPMAKYGQLRERVGEALPGVRLREPAAATDGVLALAHHSDWVARLAEGRLRADEIRAIGFPWSPEMVERSRRSAGPAWRPLAARCATARLMQAERDRRVFAFARRAGLPVAVAMGGGYCPRIEDIVEIHLDTVRQAWSHAHGSMSAMPESLQAARAGQVVGANPGTENR